MVTYKARIASVVGAVLLLFIPACTDALAVRGQVRDGQGRPAVGVEVRFISQAGVGETVAAQTDTAGFYRAVLAR